jgi:hypothetical protein
MTSFDYYAFQTKSTIDKINSEIEFYENCDYSAAPFVLEYVVYLKSRIGGAKYSPKFVCSIDRAGNCREIKKMNLDEYAKDMNIMTFNHPWPKLKELHKIMKFTEFIDGLKYSSKITESKITKNRLYLKDELIDGLKNKKFLKNKNVIQYDQEKMVIKSIDCLSLNKKKGIYEIDWD